MSLTIEGLTHKQKALMEVMWALPSMTKVTEFVLTLPYRDRQDCLSLMQMVTLDSTEQEEGLDDYLHSAQAAISHAASS
jgi:hypothetical protein